MIFITKVDPQRHKLLHKRTTEEKFVALSDSGQEDWPAVACDARAYL